MESKRERERKKEKRETEAKQRKKSILQSATDMVYTFTLLNILDVTIYFKIVLCYSHFITIFPVKYAINVFSCQERNFYKLF
jgi:hypothetical protein